MTLAQMHPYAVRDPDNKPGGVSGCPIHDFQEECDILIFQSTRQLCYCPFEIQHLVTSLHCTVSKCSNIYCDLRQQWLGAGAAIDSIFTAVPSESSTTAHLVFFFSVLSLFYRYFSGFTEYFIDLMKPSDPFLHKCSFKCINISKNPYLFHHFTGIA